MKMSRREWLRLTGAAGIASALPHEVIANATQPPQISVELKKLMLRHTWPTTM